MFRLSSSFLYSQSTFYDKFHKDISHAIHPPYILHTVH